MMKKILLSTATFALLATSNLIASQVYDVYAVVPKYTADRIPNDKFGTSDQWQNMVV